MATEKKGDVWGVCNGCGLEVTQAELAARTEPCCAVATYRLWIQVEDATEQGDLHTMLALDVTSADDPAWAVTLPGT